MLSKSIIGGLCLVPSYDVGIQRIQEDFTCSIQVEGSTNNVIWHCRLDHPSDNALSLLTNKKKSFPCLIPS